MVCNKQSLWSMYNFPNFTIKEIKALMINNLSKATQLVSVEGKVQIQVCLYSTARSVSKYTSSRVCISNADSSHELWNHISNFLLCAFVWLFHSHLKFSTSHSWAHYLHGRLCLSSVCPVLVHSIGILPKTKFTKHGVAFYLPFTFASHVQHFFFPCFSVPLPSS